MRMAMKKYNLRFFASMLAYVLVLFAVVYTLKQHHITGPLLYLLAALPALPIIGAMVSVALYLREETDEVQRAVLTQSMLWGIGITLSLASVWGFLEANAGAKRIDSYIIFPVFLAITGVAKCVIEWRYR